MKHASHTRLVQALAGMGIDESKAIDRALASARDPHKGVHEARKAIRRLRALLSFGGKIFGAEGERLDRALRALGRGLSRLRDAQVAVATMQTLARRDKAHADTWRGAIEALSARRAELLAQAMIVDPAFGRRRRRLAAVGKAIENLPWDALDDAAIADELERSRKRVDKAAKRSEDTGTAASVHRWRRRVRRLRMQLLALDTLREGGIRIRGIRNEHAALKEQTKLADALGKQQDLHVLRTILRGMPGLPERERTLALLRGRMGRTKG